jgi:hypothetical protein
MAKRYKRKASNLKSVFMMAILIIVISVGVVTIRTIVKKTLLSTKKIVGINVAKKLILKIGKLETNLRNSLLKKGRSNYTRLSDNCPSILILMPKMR